VPVQLDAGVAVELACESGSTAPSELADADEERQLSWLVERVRLHDAGDDPRQAIEVEGGRVVEALGGFYDDGWVATHAGCAIQATRDASTLRVDGWYPDWHEAGGRVVVSIGDAEPHVVEVGPGPFVVDLPVAVSSGERFRLQTTCEAEPPPEPFSSDTRPLAWQLQRLALRRD
jgi:hypothetical protein